MTTTTEHLSNSHLDITDEIAQEVAKPKEVSTLIL